MEKTEAENILKMDLKALLAEKKTLELSRYQELVKNASSGKKGSKKSIELKRKIARVETAVSQKLQEAMEAKGENNE